MAVGRAGASSVSATATKAKALSQIQQNTAVPVTVTGTNTYEVMTWLGSTYDVYTWTSGSGTITFDRPMWIEFIYCGSGGAGGSASVDGYSGGGGAGAIFWGQGWAQPNRALNISIGAQSGNGQNGSTTTFGNLTAPGGNAGGGGRGGSGGNSGAGYAGAFSGGAGANSGGGGGAAGVGIPYASNWSGGPGVWNSVRYGFPVEYGRGGGIGGAIAESGTLGWRGFGGSTQIAGGWSQGGSTGSVTIRIPR